MHACMCIEDCMCVDRPGVICPHAGDSVKEEGRETIGFIYWAM